MENKHSIKITTQDRLKQAWEESMELVRDYEMFSQQINDNEKAAQTFAQFAEEEGRHAAAFKSILEEYEA